MLAAGLHIDVIASKLRIRSVVALTLGVVLSGLLAQAQAPASATTITWAQPLLRAAEALEARYGKAVTYEDPLREWSEEVIVSPSGHARVKDHTLIIPDGVLSGSVPGVLNAGIVQSVLEAYHRQNPEGPKFRVMESPLGFHIIPAQVRDAKGALVAVKSPLDFTVDVPSENRTAFEHLQAIATAATKASGMPVVPFNSWFNEYYAANGYRISRNDRLTAADRQYMVFRWGASPMTAREALIDLLLGSASTLSWAFACGQRTTNLPGISCILNVMDVPMSGRPLYLDRRPAVQALPGH